MTYTWCQLKNGNKRTCGYIETRGAKVGNRVEMIDMDREFWEVINVGIEVSKELVRSNERMFKKWRSVTDI